jgi:hypothetical protein
LAALQVDLGAASSYRSDITQEVEFTTSYAPVIQQTVQDEAGSQGSPGVAEQPPHWPTLRLDGFVKVLPVGQIVSAGKFDHDVYRQFNTVE